MVRSGVLVVAVALCVTAPWWMRNWIVWNSPLYPQLSAETVAAPLTATITTSDPLPLPSRVFQRTVDIFRDPGRSNGAPNQLPHYIFLSILVVPLLPLKRTIVIIGGVAATYWCFTLTASAMQRHLFAVFPLLSILVGYVLSWAETRRSPIRLAPAIAVLMTVLTLLLPSRLLYTPALASYLTGAKSERQFRAAISPALNQAADWLETNADRDAKVLLCWESRIYRIRQPCVVDPATENWTLFARMADKNLAETKQWLNQQGIEFVLINMGALRYHVDADRIHTRDELKRVEKQRDLLEETLLQSVYEGPKVTIYRIRD
jgi:hypothetical protein